MDHETEQLVLEVKDTTKAFKYWADRTFVQAALRQQLSTANAIIVPVEKIREIEGPVFPQGTESLWLYLKKRESEDVKFDICISDDDYREYAFHGLLLIVAGIVMTNVIAPIVADLIADYIKDKIKKNRDNSAEINVEFSVVFPDGTAKSIKFKGPAKELGKFVDKVKEVSTSHQPMLKVPKKTTSKKKKKNESR